LLSTTRILRYRSGQRDLLYYPVLWSMTAVNSVYTSASALRRFLYRSRILRSKRLGAMVISVGNIVAGGTGKTPLVIHLAEELVQRGYKVAVLTRGYRRSFSEQRVFSGRDSESRWEDVGDEPFLISRRLPELTVGVGRDRYRRGVDILSRFSPDIFILDDGFQHQRLHRDLDVVVLDSAFPFGGNFQLKRESKTALRSADIVALNDTVGMGTINPTLEEIKKLNPESVVVVFAHKPSRLRRVGSDKITPLEEVRGLEFLAVSGIGNPFSFGTTLSQLGLKIKEHIAFPDHHRFGEKDHHLLVEKASRLATKALITTEKDAIKLFGFDKSEMPIYYVTIEVEFLQGERRFWEIIENRLQDADRE
jgi:tetraacyldisaccharide 4'-kinase